MIDTLAAAIVASFMNEANIRDIPVSEVNCVAQNVYHESRGESFEGQLGVAFVTINRTEDPRFHAKTACGVVKARKQFGWMPYKHHIDDPVAFEQSISVALIAMTGASEDPTHGATYFFDHSKGTPGWSHHLDTLAVIGGHTFKGRR